MHYKQPDLRLRIFKNIDDVKTTLYANDVVFIPSVYDYDIYETIMREIQKNQLVKWHKNSHLIVKKWKEESPTFKKIVQEVARAFNVTPNATRLNIYRNGDRGNFGISESKPFHHDRGAFTPGLSQNITIAISLGSRREVAFKHTKKKRSPCDNWKHIKEGAIISLDCTNGSIYAFSRDVNCEFQHGVLPPYDNFGYKSEIDRASIVIWGTKNDLEVRDSRVSKEPIPSSKELIGKKQRHRKYINKRKEEMKDKK